jgi:FkbM family methyltransferase
LNYRLTVTDGPNFYMQVKDEFVHRIYHFEAQRPDPLIIDGGSNMGLGILYQKRVYPQARVIGFEPDPAIYKLCCDNLERNGLGGVEVIHAGLGGEEGSAGFLPDHQAGGQLTAGAGPIQVRVEKLSRYLDQPVDFLKLNVEGQELAILQEAAASGKLGNVKELVIEYHGWPRAEQRLAALLDLLDRMGFRYLVHDLDAESGANTKPPFHLTAETVWFCLVYGKRLPG